MDIIWDTPENVSKAKEIEHFLGVNAKLGTTPENAVARETVATVVQDAEIYLHQFLHHQEPLQELEVNECLEEHQSCNSKEAAATTE